MKRKVVQQGPTTLMISLPAKWVKENNIQRGDEIDLAEEKGKLLLSVENKTSVATKDIDTSETIFNKYFINYFYQKSYDQVTVTHDDPAAAAIIKDRVKDLMGFEVTDSDEKATTIKMVMKIDEQEFDTVLRKLFQITLVMGEKLGSAIEQCDNAALQDVKQHEKENNRYADLCMRILYKNRYDYPDNGFPYFALIRELEQIGDLYKYIAESWQENKTLVPLYKSVHQFFRDYYGLYYCFDKDKAVLFFEKKTDLLKQCDEQMQKATKEDLFILCYITTLVHAIFNLKDQCS